MAVSSLFHPTTLVFPASQSTLHSSQVPLGVFVQPLCEGKSLPLVSYGLKEVIRCAACGGYLSPFVVWVAAGWAWMCPLCKARNGVPDDFYQPLNDDGRRVDESQREDLRALEYDIEAPESYIERPPMPPTYCFVIDCSQAAKSSGLLDAFLETILEILSEESFPGLPRTQVSFILFSSEVHLLSFPPNCPHAQLLTLGRTTETAFLPVPLDHILVNLADKTEEVREAVGLIGRIGERGVGENSAFRMAVMYVHSILHAEGGRAVIVMSDFENAGNWKQGAAKDGLPHSYDSWYQTISKEYRSLNISCDLFLASTRFIDLVSLAYLPEASNGQLFFYPNLTPHQKEKVTAEAYLSLTRNSMWDTSIRLRVNSDWKVIQAYGSFHLRAGDLFSTPVFDSSQVLLYRLELDDSVVKQGKIYLQAAVLYTTDSGERRIRVINAGLKVSNDREEVLAAGIQENIAAMWAKQAIVHSAETNDYNNGKLLIENQLKGLYTALGYGNLPPSLSFLPYYCFGLIKLSLFTPLKATVKGGLTLGTDQSAFIRYVITTSPPTFICQLAYPRLYSLSPVLESEEFALQPLNLSFKSLSREGVYCLDTGLELFLWIGTNYIGPEVGEERMEALFGEARKRVVSEKELSERGTMEAERVKEVVSRVRCEFGRFQVLHIYTRGNPSELQ